jgi:recombination protein RecA
MNEMFGIANLRAAENRVTIAVIRSRVEACVPGALSVYRHQKIEETLCQSDAAMHRGISNIPKSALTQICTSGAVYSGRSVLLLALLSELTRGEHFCALVDASDNFNPETAEAVAVETRRLLWVRCGTHGASRYAEKGKSAEVPSACTDEEQCATRTLTVKEKAKTRLGILEQAFKAADILVQNGGFELIVVDLSGVEERELRKVPLSTWFRFARVVEQSTTALVFLMAYPAAQSCAALTLHITGEEACWAGHEGDAHTQIVQGVQCATETGRARMKKAVQSTRTSFQASALWG